MVQRRVTRVVVEVRMEGVFVLSGVGSLEPFFYYVVSDWIDEV